MPESKVRPEAAAKKKLRRHENVERIQREKSMQAAPTDRPWLVPALFLTAGLLGIAWLVVYYVAPSILFFGALGGWNIIIGMALIALAFLLMIFWK